MDKRILYYSGLIWGKLPLIMAIGISILALILACTDTNTPVSLRPEVTTRYLTWLGGIGAILAAVSILHPESPGEIEPLATVPAKASRLILSRWTIVLILNIIPAWVALLVATLLSDRPLLASWASSAIAYLSAIVLLGGVALFISAIGRQSLIGIVGGIFLLLIVTLVPIPERFQAINLLRSGEAWIQPNLWWGSRLTYFLIGIVLGWVGSVRLGDFDYLLTGGRTNSVRPNTSHSTIWKRKPNSFPDQFFAFGRNALPLGSGFLANEWVYDAWQVLLRGALPIAVLSLVIVTCGLACIGLNWELHLAIDAPRSAMLFGTIIIPLLTCDTIPAERRIRSDQLSLSALSLPAYIKDKISGNVVVVLIVLLIGALPVCIFYLLTIMMDTRLSIAALVMWFGITLPYFGYLTAVSTQLGALFSGRSGYAVGVILAIGGIILYVLAGEIPILNYIFPCGPAAADTLLGFAQGFPLERLSGPSLVVPLWSLALFPLSALIQIIVLYKVSTAILLRRPA